MFRNYTRLGIKHVKKKVTTKCLEKCLGSKHIFYSVVNKHVNSTKHISIGRFHWNSIPYAHPYSCSMTEQTRLNPAMIPDSSVQSGSPEVQNHAHPYHGVQWCRNI